MLIFAIKSITMVAERDIVAVSLPFVAGVMASAFPGTPSQAAHFSFLAGASLLLYLLYRPQSRTVLYLVLFFALGMFCHGGAGIFGSAELRPGPLAEDALSALSSRIGALGFPHAGTNSLLRALLTGQRDMLDADTINSFRAAGAAHILALSGLHLGIIYLIAGKALSVFGRSRGALLLRSVLLAGLSGFYAVMTGASPSIVRAFIFIIINEFVRNSPGRERRPLNVWCAALMIQLTLAPSAIMSAGFQLSYLAMLGIFAVFPKMEAWYPGPSRRDPVRRVWSALSLSCSCQLFTAPLVWLRFGTFPKYFILTNLLAMPLTSALMMCGLGCVALSALGVSHEWLLIITDSLAEILQGCLGTIAGM